LAEQYGVNPEGIVFEITESADIEHFNLISTVLEALKGQGYRFSLDDFGTGYASMTHFKRLPFSQVKIDQSFITDIVDNEDSLAIVEVVLAMARSLKLEVIAEGVETQSQLDILNRLGCTGYQGYLFSKPLRAHAITSLIGKNGAHLNVLLNSTAQHDNSVRSRLKGENPSTLKTKNFIL